MNVRCRFCGKEYDTKEKTLFKSDVEDLLICEDCVEACNQALADAMKLGDKEEEILSFDDGDVPTFNDGSEMLPSEMKKHFDDYIIKQDRAKKKIAVAIYNHYKRVFYNEVADKDKLDIKLKKSNVLMVGPSGSGKTLFVETIAKKIGIPYVIQDATSLTQSGL